MTDESSTLDGSLTTAAIVVIEPMIVPTTGTVMPIDGPSLSITKRTDALVFVPLELVAVTAKSCSPSSGGMYAVKSISVVHWLAGVPAGPLGASTWLPTDMVTPEIGAKSASLIVTCAAIEPL